MTVHSGSTRCTDDDLPGIVREHSGVAGREIERASIAITNEYRGLSLALVEVEPLLGLAC
jgi:hypothetical protein